MVYCKDTVENGRRIYLFRGCKMTDDREGGNYTEGIRSRTDSGFTNWCGRQVAKCSLYPAFSGGKTEVPTWDVVPSWSYPGQYSNPILLYTNLIHNLNKIFNFHLFFQCYNLYKIP